MMNSLNILSALGSPPLPPSQSVRSQKRGQKEECQKTATGIILDKDRANTDKSNIPVSGADSYNQSLSKEGNGQDVQNEKSPLLPQQPVETFSDNINARGFWKAIPKRIVSAIIGSLRVVISALLAPGYYIIACFYDDNGKLSSRSSLQRIGRLFQRNRWKSKSQKDKARRTNENLTKRDDQFPFLTTEKLYGTSTASNRSSSTESEIDTDVPTSPNDTPSRNTRSRNKGNVENDENYKDVEKSRRTRLQGEESRRDQRLRKSKGKKQSRSLQFDSAIPETEAAAALLKSPTSPGTGLKVTKYPKTPTPPQPLIPRRQLSYVFGNTAGAPLQKTLIIDLDETLIHSMAKGGRMSTGHMVEVKLQHPVGIGGTIIGPQVPILYYVHKRPHCDEFLRKVSKWYNLIIFTASVQEYADPVIDWLEQERQYFSGRYYRQHCTFRNGAYIKDLSHIEPDLTKVMILDNSPMSYVFHEDNAIPIEGWISDPTDNDLLHLIPMMEALQYATDVRAFLALRLGEPMAT